MTQCPCCKTKELPCAAKISIFQQLDLESLREITSIAIHRKVKKGELLFSPEENFGLFLISEGRIKVYELTPSGKEYLLRVLNPGDFTGEESLFIREKTYTYGEALTDGEICFIGRQEFLSLLGRYPSISLKLLEEFSRRMVQATHRNTENMSEPVLSRLVGYLLNLSEAQESCEIEIPLQLKELSSYLSTTPETLSRRLTDLQKKGMLLKKGRTIQLLDVENLRKIKG